MMDNDDEDQLHELYLQYARERLQQNKEPATYRNWKRQWSRSRSNYAVHGVPHPYASMSSTPASSPDPHLQILQQARLAAFPPKALVRSGSVLDLNQHRVAMVVKRTFVDNLPEVPAPTAEVMRALLRTFCSSRYRSDGTDLFDCSVMPMADGEFWRFPFESGRGDDVGKENERGWHGTHVEALHSILRCGALAESSPAVQGARYFTGRPGVYLHRDANRRLCESYMTYVRWGSAPAYLGVLLEVVFDRRHSRKAGHSTNQVIIAAEGVRLVAVHLRVLTKSSLSPGLHIREWVPSLEVDPEQYRS